MGQTEIWQSAALLESASGQRGIGLCTQGVLWSDAQVFAAHSETGGSALMFAITEWAVQQLKGQTFSNPIELLDGLLLVKEPQHSLHRTGVLLVAKAVERAFGEGWFVQTQSSIILDDRSEDADALLARLRDLGFIAGARCEIVASMWLGGDPLVVRIGGSTFALRRAEAAAVRVLRQQERLSPVALGSKDASAVTV